MLAVVLALAGFWFLMAFSEPQMHLRVGLISMGLGYVLSWYVPRSLKNRHVKAQNRLLERCRALLLLGSRALESGNKLAAEQILKRIERLESLWHLGHSIPFRTSLAIWAVAWGLIACVLIRFAGVLIVQYGWSSKLVAWESLPSELWLMVLVSLTAVLHALSGYFEDWVDPWAVENCGARLRQHIYGPRGLGVVPETEKSTLPDFDGLSPREIFGLGPSFTRRDLDRKRRRMVQELHPDRWHNASGHERKTREETLKRVNAAYDVLRPSAL
jgi:hypothetical protein